MEECLAEAAVGLERHYSAEQAVAGLRRCDVFGQRLGEPAALWAEEAA